MWALGLLLIATSGACGSELESSSESGDRAETLAAESSLQEVTVENLLLITIDTLRADVLGFTGNDRVATPALDRLAAAGLVFASAHAHSVVTLPSHANILTGLYPYEHSVRENSGFALPPDVPTMATLLHAAGFATAAFVAAYPLDARYGLGRGFDVYSDDYPKGSYARVFTFPERPGNEVVGQAVAWWRENQGRRRFLWVHLFEPHAPYSATEPFASRHPMDPYLAEVEQVDAILAPLLEPFLSGSEPPTFIVLTSDHGEALGDHGEQTHGLFAYESTLKVPLVVWAPGLDAGRSQIEARHVDLLPTMLTVAGLELPAGISGRSLIGPEVTVDPPVTYFEALGSNLNYGWAPLRGILKGSSKLISLPVPELYDLESDPAELDNLFARDRDQARSLAQLLPSESVWPPSQGEVTGEESAALQSLGYLSGRAKPRTTFGEEDDPKNLVELDNKIHRVIQLYQQQRLDEALRVANEVIEARPDMGSAYSVLAQVLLERGETEVAIEAMERAADLGVASESLIRQLGLSLTEVGRFQEALRLLEPRAASGDRDVLNALGVVLSEAGRQQEARQILLEVLAADPQNPVARENLALVALRLGKWAEARDQARLALGQNPTLGLAWNYLGTALYNLGQRREALTALRHAVEYESDNFDALYNVAAVAIELGDQSVARAALLEFIGEAPPDQYAADIQQARIWLRQIGG